MSVYFLYASFPNSRLKNRNPTVEAVTYQVPLSNLDQPLTLISPANLNRTYILLKNLDDQSDMWYIYAQDIVFDPSVVPTFGVKNQLLYNSGANLLYEKQSTGTGIDWTLVTIDTVGERVEPFQSATLESLEAIWCSSDIASSPPTPPLTTVIAGIDEGRG